MKGRIHFWQVMWLEGDRNLAIITKTRFRFAESLAPLAKGSLRSPFASGGLSRRRRSCFALDFPRVSGAHIWINCLESSLWQRLGLRRNFVCSGVIWAKIDQSRRSKALLFGFLFLFVCFFCCLFVCLFFKTCRYLIHLKVFWSSGRPLLCFPRFWPFENVARICRVYVAYSQTKRVHTRNLAPNAKGKCAFVLIALNDRITSYIGGKLVARTKFHNVLWKTKGLARTVT